MCVERRVYFADIMFWCINHQVTHDGALGLLKDLKLEGYALMCCSYPNSDLVVELQDEDEVRFAACSCVTAAMV